MHHLQIKKGFQRARIYVASSWRNPMQQAIVHHLRVAGHAVYDFRNPAPGNTGFTWSSIDPKWKEWTPEGFRRSLDHPVAQRGYGFDFQAMEWANQCVLVLPTGRSAHLEAGWFMGKGKPVTILAMESIVPELMYLLAGSSAALCISVDEMIDRVCDLEKPACFVDTADGVEASFSVLVPLDEEEPIPAPEPERRMVRALQDVDPFNSNRQQA